MNPEQPIGLNRRDFLKGTSAAAIAASMAAPAAPTAGAALPADAKQSGARLSDAKPIFASAPLLVNPSSQGVLISIAINAPASGWVEYGPTAALGQRADGSDRGLMPFGQRVLSFSLCGLPAGKRCYYRVHACPVDFTSAYSIHRGQEAQTPIHSFRTLDPGAEQASFTVWNDTHEHDQTIAALATALQKEPTDFLFWNGDIFNSIGDDEKIVEQVFLSPAAGAVSSGSDAVPLLMTRGNHDVRGPGARRLPDYLAGPEGAYFYQFRHGPVAFLVMDTGEDKPDGSPAYAGLCDFAAYRTAQQAWLANAIEDPQFRSAPFRVAFLHIPLTWEAPVPDRWTHLYGPSVRGWVCDDGKQKWHDLLIRGRIDLVISGHTHHGAFFPATANRPYAQLIGGGPALAQATRITAQATRTSLRITMHNLHGKALTEHEFSA